MPQSLYAYILHLLSVRLFVKVTIVLALKSITKISIKGQNNIIVIFVHVTCNSWTTFAVTRLSVWLYAILRPIIL